jgi:ATP-binding cassette, subfamily B, multidrug efflux pump
MDRGHIIEQGSHTELLAAGGFYYDLYTSQFLEPLAEDANGAPQLRGQPALNRPQA